jgi:hypothetical protein
LIFILIICRHKLKIETVFTSANSVEKNIGSKNRFLINGVARKSQIRREAGTESHGSQEDSRVA